MTDQQNIIPVNIEDEMKSAYIDYAMSVIVSRALPDVRDGLKPVQRRVLYGMTELGLSYNKQPRKSARIVGEVLGKYHPHGDSSVYDAMVRMAQDWSLRYPLVQGQGNFGSMDGDSPAAMRYTEARLSRISEELLADIKKETVDFRLNFDDSLEEPTVLPARIPNLLINGASGIAVGMATNMLPHNLGEVIDGVIATIDNRDITIDELCEYIKGPDFPTGGMIYGYAGVKEAFETGRGRIIVRGKADIVQSKTGMEQIVISEIPFMLNKASLHIKIAELVKEEKVTGISDVRDESDRNGVRLVIDVKRDAMASIVLSKVYKYTSLQTSYGVNNVTLVNGRPQLLNLKQLIEEFIKFRMEIIVRRTQYDLRKAEERAHILEGYLIALDNLDEVIKLIRASKDGETAKIALIDRFSFSEIQAKAILDMRLQRLTGLERQKIKDEYDELLKTISYYKELLGNESMRYDVMKEELQEIKEKYGDERRTEIVYSDGEISIEDLIPNEKVVVTISHLGYIKRTNLDEYRSQVRGGRGSRGSKTRDADYVEHMFISSNHNYLLLFTESGICHWLRIYEIPEAGKNSSGRVLQNILALPKEDKIRAYINVPDLENEEFLQENFVVFATKNGVVKKTSLKDFSRPRSNGIIAINIKDNDQLLEAKLSRNNGEIILANRMGRAIRFDTSDVRVMGRTAAGVRGMSLANDQDEVIGMVVLNEEDHEYSLLVVSENGLGKRSIISDYRKTRRGGKGVKTLQISDKTGNLIALKSVLDSFDLMISNKSGITIRTPIKDIRIMGRATQGVKIINLTDGDSIADVALVKSSDKDEEE